MDNSIITDMIIEKPSNRDDWQGADSRHNSQYQPNTGGIRITGTDLFGKKITGMLIAVNDAGVPMIIISDNKIYERCEISGYFYCKDLATDLTHSFIEVLIGLVS